MPNSPFPRAVRGVPRPASRAIPVLDGIRVSWEWLCTPPHPVTLDAAALIGLSTGPLPLDEVRVRLLDRGCPSPVRDGVWAYLIGRSRVDGPTWTVACAGMALPMLATVCRSLCGGRGVQRDDVASGIVTGFVAALAVIDLNRPQLTTSLRWAAIRGGHTVLREERGAPHPMRHDELVRAALTQTGRLGHPAGSGSGPDNDADHDGGDGAGRGHGLAPAGRWESAPPPAVGGHPDLVLAAAVDDGVLTRAEAALIGETRLEPNTLAQAAARRGRSVSALTMQRLRAEMRLVDHLHASESPDTAEGAARTGGGRGEGTQAAGRGRSRRHRRPRTVTGHRSDTAGPRAPGCARGQSPSVSTTRPAPRRHNSSGLRGGDGWVTR